ncbi:MAG: hypothetical protein JNM76_07435 [Betaproteobacteria bacterium]|nr:hypothetical protein [Betaproteobacteria bacterium]
MIQMSRTTFQRFARAVLTTLLATAALDASAQSSCGGKLLVSGYFSNNVHIYDACTGAHLRNLDTANRINGAQAIRLGPDGALHLVSENTSRILRYRADNFEFLGEFIAVANGTAPTGLTFGPGGEVYVGGYSSDDVKRYDANGKNPTRAVTANASGVNGPDNGLLYAPDGKLYVPGYDSNSIIRLDPATGATSVAIAAQANGLRGSRGILADRDNQHLWITGELSGQLLKYNMASGSVQVVASGLNRPTGIEYGLNNELLLITGEAVRSVNPATGALGNTIVPTGTGGLNGPTFVLLLRNEQAKPPIDTAQVGSQYWLTGATTMSGNALDFGDMQSATGALFGTSFAATDVQRKRWGRMRIEFTSCTTANFTWQSDETNSAGFGNGGYALSRIVNNEATARCQQQGFAAADKSWIVGTWWGGESRSGEGILIDHRASDGLTFAAWFTFRTTR